MLTILLSGVLLLSYTQKTSCLPGARKQDGASQPFAEMISTDGQGVIYSAKPHRRKPTVEVPSFRLHDGKINRNESFWPMGTKSMFTKQNISVESLTQLENANRPNQQRLIEEPEEDTVEWDEPPTTSNETISQVVIELNGDAFLPCRVGHLGDRQVSWIRKRDWFVLTSGDLLYSHNNRFVVLHEDGSQDWVLRIKKVEESDQGYYECQVSTGTGIISFLTHVQVIVPKAQLSGSRQLHINTGSAFFLRCFISKANPGLQHINWLHNGKLLNYDLNAEGISIFTKSSKTQSDQEESESQDHLTNRYIIMSQIDVQGAEEAHSGNYTCEAPHVQNDTAYVYVNEGDKTAAVQRIGMSSASTYHCSAIFMSAILFLNMR